MAEYLIQDTSLINIADAIRRKTGKTDSLTPEQMVVEIDSLVTVNEIRATLFDNGDQCISVTGGWTNSDWAYYEYSIVSSTISNTQMTVTGSYNGTTQNSSASIVGTANQIGLDNIYKIYADIEITTAGTIFLCACSTKDTGYNDANVSVATVGTHTVELDVSSLTGDYYIAILAIGSSYGYYPSANITKVWTN